MKQPIRMIAFDLDNTLLTNAKQVTPRTVSSIQNAIQAGFVVVPATGRPLHGIPKEVLAIPGIAYALTTNGAMVYNLLDESVVYADCLNKPAALELLDILDTYNSLASVFMEGRGFAQADNIAKMKDLVGPEIQRYIDDSRYSVPDLHAHITESARPVEKFSMFFPDQAERKRALGELGQRPDLCVTSSLANNIEINTPTANKGAGLVALGAALGIPAEEILAIGDSTNDIAMLRAVGIGVAMGNAHEEVKQVADHITLSNEQDGVAEVIERVLAR